ncbi:MAG TPA: hypothetical protein VLG76_07570 [Rhabdochlamydiaceae bacterium]|nr:hypothetical protein [Rhabdochlamydiaceae bacterium]
MKKLFLFSICILSCVSGLSAAATDFPVEIQFENAEMKSYKITLPPNKTTGMHRDDHNRVLIALKGGKLKKVDQTGEVAILDLESGKSYYLTPDPPGALHTTTNISKNPIELIVVEFKE